MERVPGADDAAGRRGRPRYGRSWMTTQCIPPQNGLAEQCVAGLAEHRADDVAPTPGYSGRPHTLLPGSSQEQGFIRRCACRTPPRFRDSRVECDR